MQKRLHVFAFFFFALTFFFFELAWFPGVLGCAVLGVLCELAAWVICFSTRAGEHDQPDAQASASPAELETPPRSSAP